MIEYEETFRFANDIADFTINAHTEEHPSAYGNGTLLVFDVESDYPCERRRIFDVRYEGSDMAAISRYVIRNDYGYDA